MGRPKLQIDSQQLFKLAKIGCTSEEMAEVLGCSIRVLERRFAATINRGRKTMDMSLRRAQCKAALSGNPTMLVWLGKQRLGQKDRQEITGADGGPIQHAYQGLTDEQLSAKIADYNRAIGNLEASHEAEDLGKEARVN